MNNSCHICGSAISDGICNACMNKKEREMKENLMKVMEEFMNTNYPPEQYKYFNSRVIEKIKNLFNIKD